MMTLAVRRTRLACAVWSGAWAAASDGSLLTGALMVLLFVGTFDLLHRKAAGLRAWLRKGDDEQPGGGA